MDNTPFVKITDVGVAFLGQRPADVSLDPDGYGKKPVQISIRHDLSIELHGAGFSVRTKITPDQALGMISMLAYVVREKIPVAGKAQ